MRTILLTLLVIVSMAAAAQVGNSQKPEINLNENKVEFYSPAIFNYYSVEIYAEVNGQRCLQYWDVVTAPELIPLKHTHELTSGFKYYVYLFCADYQNCIIIEKKIKL